MRLYGWHRRALWRRDKYFCKEIHLRNDVTHSRGNLAYTPVVTAFMPYVPVLVHVVQFCPKLFSRWNLIVMSSKVHHPRVRKLHVHKRKTKSNNILCNTGGNINVEMSNQGDIMTWSESNETWKKPMEQWILNSNSAHTISYNDNNNTNNTYYSKDLRSHTIPGTSYAHIWMFWWELYQSPEACKIWSCGLISRCVTNWSHHFYSLTAISRNIRIVLPRNRSVMLTFRTPTVRILTACYDKRH
jgi:hypothetical protein